MTATTTTKRGPKHEASCPCMGCEQKIPHGDVQTTAIGVMHRSCAYLLGWVATREGTDPSDDARSEWAHAAAVAA
jgi:hypothetical protein